ncbi:MAG: putative outer membrane protein, partial [Chitinophagaceae bacterium]|nr:putative outer membrane protein [Chitinophagaceae bacterium]
MRKTLAILVMVLSAAITNAQSKTLKGTITDEKGTPLPGVSVSVKAKPNLQGAVSNAEGVYEIKVPDPVNDIVVFTNVGFTTQEIKVNNRSSINVTLQVSHNQLDDVIVISALGINRKQKSLTYASQNVDPKTLTEARDVNFMSALSGKIAGLQVTGTG